MRYLVLATDYDGTLAHHGQVSDETLKSLEKLRRSGRSVLLVTGRRLAELREVFPELDQVVDAVVVENGATVYWPESKKEEPLADPPREDFINALRRRSVAPLATGQVIVATLDDQKEKVLDAIQELGLELQIIFNKGSLMILPSGVNKASGLETCLRRMGLSLHNVVGVGDAENDHAFLRACECSAAVANALPTLKETANLVLTRPHGEGVSELIDGILHDELASAADPHRILLGERENNAGPLEVPAYGCSILVAGSSGGGKSTLTTGFLERLVEQGYQFCAVDPEGDYNSFGGAVILGDAKHSPTLEEIFGVLADPAHSIIVNLLGFACDLRPNFAEGMLPRMQEQRAKTGRPHWIVVDEAHHLLPASWESAALVLPKKTSNLLMITLEPDRMARPVLESIDLLIAVGRNPGETIERFARAVGVAPPDVTSLPELEKGTALAWWKDGREAPVKFRVAPCHTDRVRHSRKYAEAELIPERSFYFRGPEAKLNLRASNLASFLQMMDGVDEETWQHHFNRGDYSSWFRDKIKDETLATDAEALERERPPADEARKRLRELVESRYTLPA